jgi:hypothetical protein
MGTTTYPWAQIIKRYGNQGSQRKALARLRIMVRFSVSHSSAPCCLTHFGV